MLGLLIRKELLGHILSLRFLVLSGIGAAVVWLSLYSGYTYYTDSLQDYNEARAATEDRIREIDASENYSEFVSEGFMVHKPPAALSVFVRGLDPILGRSMLTRFTNRPIRSWVETKPLLAVFPSLDLKLVVQVVLGLFVLLLTYDAVCGEKEAGTLRLGASYPVPRHLFLLGKVCGSLVLTWVAFGLPLLLGAAVILGMPELHLSAPELWPDADIAGAALDLVVLVAWCALALVGSWLAVLRYDAR